MSQTLINGDKVIVSKTTAVKPNQIVLFTYGNSTYIKRCIGEPGDKLTIVNNEVFINGNKFDMPVTGISGTRSVDANNMMILEYYNQNWSLENFGPVIVPKKGMVITMDAKNQAVYRTIINAEQNISGNINRDKVGQLNRKYTFKYDYFFFMGDNRHHSDDSRIFGFIPCHNVIGITKFVLFSYADKSRFFLTVK